MGRAGGRDSGPLGPTYRGSQPVPRQSARPALICSRERVICIGLRPFVNFAPQLLRASLHLGLPCEVQVARTWPGPARLASGGVLAAAATGQQHHLQPRPPCARPVPLSFGRLQPIAPESSLLLLPPPRLVPSSPLLPPVAAAALHPVGNPAASSCKLLQGLTASRFPSSLPPSPDSEEHPKNSPTCNPLTVLHCIAWKWKIKGG